MLLLQHFTKLCTKCQEIKSFSFFSKDKNKKDGKVINCKVCCKAYRDNNKDIIIERRKAFYKNNKNAILKQRKEYYLENKEEILDKRKKYCDKNKKVILSKNREYRTKNIELLRENCKTYETDNKESLSEYRRDYYIKNKEKISTYGKTYKASLNGKMSQKNSIHKRRTKEKQGDVTTSQFLELQQNAKVCYWCNCSLKKAKVHIDHYVPLSKGGKHTLDNLVVSCQKCNNQKHSIDPLEFANSIGKLL